MVMKIKNLLTATQPILALQIPLSWVMVLEHPDGAGQLAVSVVADVIVHGIPK